MNSSRGGSGKGFFVTKKEIASTTNVIVSVVSDSVTEGFIKILVEKKGFSREEAEKKVAAFLQNNRVKLLNTGAQMLEEDLKHEMKTNTENQSNQNKTF